MGDGKEDKECEAGRWKGGKGGRMGGVKMDNEGMAKSKRWEGG
jgi:hypothetical protein